MAEVKNATAEDQHKANLAKAREELARGVNIKALPAPLLKAVEDEYSYAVEVITSDKDLMQLFTNAVRGQWSDAKFELEARNNKWFLDRTSSEEWYDMRKLDPSYAKELSVLKDDILVQVRNVAVQQFGLNVNDANIMAKVDAVAQDILENHTQSSVGWQNKIVDLLGSKVQDLKPSDFGARVADGVQSIYGTARGLGLPINDVSLTNYVKDIVGGKKTTETIQADLRKQAAGMWTQFSDRIMGGESLTNILYPFTQLIGSMLEIDTDSLDFTVDDPSKPMNQQIDPLLQKALFSSADGKTVMSLTDLRKAIKADDRWQYTKNAQSEYADLATRLKRMFVGGS